MQAVALSCCCWCVWQQPDPTPPPRLHTYPIPPRSADWAAKDKADLDLPPPLSWKEARSVREKAGALWRMATYGMTYDIHAVVEEDPIVAAIHAQAEHFDPKTEYAFSYLQVCLLGSRRGWSGGVARCTASSCTSASSPCHAGSLLSTFITGIMSHLPAGVLCHLCHLRTRRG
jgi:hypothetical protein